MKGDVAEMPLGLRLAYVGAIALPVMVGGFAAFRSPESLDGASEAPRRHADEPERDREEHATPGPHSSSSPSASPTSHSSSPLPKIKVPTPEARAASDAFDHSLKVNDLKGALGQLEKLLEIDPDSPKDDAVRADIVDLTMRIQLVAGPEPDKMFDLLVNRMGTTGIDIVYQIVTTKGGSKASAMGERFLASPDVRARGTDALRAAYDLRTAKSCEAKRAVFGEVAAHGDARSLGQLYLLNRKCGRRHRAEAGCCLQGDAELAKTIETLEKRDGK